jgi:hypothetical protein
MFKTMLTTMFQKRRRLAHELLDDLSIIPQYLVRKSKVKTRKLLLLNTCLVLLCVLLGMSVIEGQKALSRISILEHETREKEAKIEELRNKTKELEEQLSFKHKVDALVSRVQQQAPSLDKESIRLAAEKALRHTSDPALYLAIGVVEAGLKADVVHTDGVALGMHGLCPKDWHKFLVAKGIMKTIDDYFDPVKSFMGSEAIMKALLREWGSLEVALRFYNGGRPAALGQIPQSVAYAKRVLQLKKILDA